MAKAPLAGRVKTRLCPPCTPAQAAELAEAALSDTLEAATTSGADEVILALAGEPGAWLPAGVRVIAQRGDDFNARLADAWDRVGGPAFQIGMDTPQVDATVLDAAMARFDDATVDAALGPAHDGGWWGLGLRRADRRVFAGVPMSRADTGDRQMARLVDLGLRTERLGALTDVDTIDDARRVARLCPASRFSAAFDRCEFPAS